MSEQEQEFSFYNLFVPLTIKKANIIFIVAGFIVYFNALFNGFVWDDLPFIISNPDIHVFNLVRLFGVNSFNSSGYYRPIPAVYFSLLYNVFSTNAFFYHFFQVTLHIVDVCLLFYLLKKFFRKNIAFLLSLVFLIHPIQVESVAYIGAIQSELFFFFGITALLLSMQEALKRRYLFLISVLSLFALLTKETGFLFIVLILLFQFIYQKKRFLKLLTYETVMLVMYLFIRFFIGQVFFEKIAFVPIGRLSLLGRLITMPEILFYYIKTFFYPAKLAVEQHWVVNTIDLQHFYLPLLCDLLFFSLLGLLGIFVYRKNKKSFTLFCFFLFWFLTGLCMLLQIFPLDMTVADRWFYFPMGGLLGMFGVGASMISLQKKWKMVSVLFLVVVLIILSIRTIIRNQNWYSPLTLYAHDLPLEDNFDNENNYAAALSYEGRWHEAFGHIQKSVALFPYEKNLRELGLVYKHLGQKQLAKAYFYKALNAKGYLQAPYHHESYTYEYIAKFEYLYGDTQKATQIAKLGLVEYPENINLLILLAISEYKLHDRQGAIVAVDKGYALSPNAQIAYVRNQIRNDLPVSIKTSF